MLVSEALKSARLKANMTLKEVAEALHVSHVAIHKFENGIGSQPSIDRLIQLADLYEVTLDELVGRQ